MLRDALARAGKRAGLSEVRIEHDVVRKRRFPWATPLASAQNLALAALGEPLRILSGEAWHQRERRAWEGRIELVDGWLVVPRRPGLTLAQALRAEPQNTRALLVAVHALRALHARGLTHGDASADNVCVHDGAAGFFDFEQEHMGPDPERVGREDDLVALVYSALSLVDEGACALHVAQLRASLDGGERTILARYARAYPRRPPYLQQARMDGRSAGYLRAARLLAS